ncbi:MAG TPA: DUF1559 domain-containing protein [Planctomycetaceae bacterium]|nr:DUF1559 domain-containing protein [Planctomycetaceae bacterium]
MFQYLRMVRLNALLAVSAATVLAWSNAHGAEPALAVHDPAKTQDTREKLEKLASAMRKYHDRYKHFPPAVVIGPDGKTSHSWRVTLLPFLGEEMQRLYANYKLDEPWDSPANKKVLDQMPDIFHSCYDDPKSTNSAFYVLVGPGTVFEGSKGIKISEITDEASLTLLIVEAKRKVPWTKPEDIPYDPKKPIPELGGFEQGSFGGAMADGSSHMLSKKVRAIILRGLIERNDGHDLSQLR